MSVLEQDQRLVAHLAKLANDARFFGEKKLRRIPFPAIVAALYGKRVIPLPKDAPLVARLRQAAQIVAQTTQGRVSERRINEEGNGFEPVVCQALVDVGLKAQPCRPTAGYPDLSISKGFGEHTYIEVKMFATGSDKSTFRSFYMSPPSREAKVTEDAHHVVMAFEQKRSPEKRLSTVSWKLLDLSCLSLDIKLEIFTSNKGMYQTPAADLGHGPGFTQDTFDA